MTAILGIVDTAARQDGAEIARRMLTRMAARGCDQGGIWTDAGITLAAVRHDWECRAGFSGPVLVVRDAHVVVVADATLYYRDDLRKRLSERRIRVAGQTPSHLIAAAYRAWGDRCAEYLEGDFAFVLWDLRAKQMVAARDVAGGRPLYYSESGTGGVAFASSARALLGQPTCDSSLNLEVLAQRLAGFARTNGTTCYAGVSRVEAGEAASFALRRGLSTFTYWDASVVHEQSRSREGDSGLELCSLLSRAVDERRVASQRAAIWLTDDFGSTSVFAAAMSPPRDRASDVIPVALLESPDEDDGRRKRLDQLSAALKIPVRWVAPNADGESLMPLRILDHDGVAAAALAEPLHAVTSAAVRVGVRVALDGNGSGRVFSGWWQHRTDAVHGDLKQHLARESPGAETAQMKVAAVVRGLLRHLPNSIGRASHRSFDARPVRDDAAMRFPEWIEPAFARRSLSGGGIRQRNGESVDVGAEASLLGDPLGSNAMAARAALALAHGVELRSPYCDKRVVAFVASQLLAAPTASDNMQRRMIALLIPGSAAERQESCDNVENVRASYARRLLLARLTSRAEPTRLTQLGLIDLTAFRRTCDRYRYTLDDTIAFGLSLALETEQWLRLEEGSIAADANSDHVASMPLLASAG